jgi:hypothetical protein
MSNGIQSSAPIPQSSAERATGRLDGYNSRLTAANERLDNAVSRLNVWYRESVGHSPLDAPSPVNTTGSDRMESRLNRMDGELDKLATCADMLLTLIADIEQL